ncbi:unnamed protein product [Chilo suppressalis]|uniref:C2H2-type domain-containing protein n=1 Tax=Chilo suppressalis TaxID=168631 RepID=A0ABN8L9N7_CHISP|nr:unnamed protein product [Chilo suppressalis]
MNIVDDNISYVIPLDEIDLNYYYGKDYFSNDPMPLWNTNSSIYYELKIFAQRKSQLNQTRINGTDESFTENPKYQCHICNSSVPIVYKKQHINSQKHKTFLKIIETVMVRARHCLVQTQDDNHQLKPMQHSYYCEPCSTEVKIINREDHDMSKDHFKSLMHVKFLNDLLKIYIDKEHLEKVDFEYMTDDPANYAQNGNCKQHECDADDLNENDEINKFLDLMQNLDDNDDAQNLCNESENETTSPSSLTDIEVIAGKETTDTKTTTSNGTQLKVTNLKEYIDMLLSNENAQISNKITVIGDRLNIEAVDKSIVTVSEDNFHSFMRDADGKVTFCKVCDVSIKDKNSHVLTPEHMRRVMAPIQDMHGIRQVRSDSESSSELPLPRLTLKRVTPNKLAEEKIDQVLEEIKREDGDEWVTVDTASGERSTLVPFKKRRYVEALADDNSETTICTVEEKQVLKQSITIEKAHKPKAMSSDESDGEEKRQDEKKQQHMQQQPEAELPQLTNEPSSSSMMHAPCQDEARAGTSASECGSSQKQHSLQEFWLGELRKNFNELEYSKVLRDAEFTEEQSEILQQSFAQLSRKMSYIKAHSERFLKTHKCRRCEFSISHQCMPLDFMRSVPFGTELMAETLIVPHQTVVCDCGFAFSHTHLKRTRRPVKQSYAERYTPHLQLYMRSVNVSCPKCYTKIVMNSLDDNVCCELATWDCIAGNEREMFYTGIKRCLAYSGTDAPPLDEFFACSKGCCLIYHHCSEG